jgi:hypothetical protein
MTSRRSAPVGMATRARSTASGIARFQARSPAPGRVQPGTCLSQEIAGATGSVAAILTDPMGNASRSFPIGGTPSSPNLPSPSLGGKIPLRGDFPAPADGLSTGAVAIPEGLVTDDLQARVIALEDETTSLRMVINHLEAENAHCSEELAIIRLAMRELEALILPPIAPDGEDQKKKVQSTKKTSSSRGDSPNSRKNKLRKQASDSSSEGDTSEEDDVHTHVGLGPAVPGLTELTTRRPEFKELLSYRAYRLADVTQKVDGAAHNRLSSLLRRLKYHLEEKFSGDPAIKVLDFLKSFREAADINDVSEGLAAILLPYFLEGKAKAGLATRVKRLDAKVPRYPAAVQWLLQSFASEAIIAAAHQRVYTARQAVDEDEEQFADRLTKYAGDAGSVFSEDSLIAAFVDGLHPFASNTIRGQITTKMTFAEVQLLAEQAGNASRAIEKAQKPTPRSGNVGLSPIRVRPVLSAVAGSYRRDPEMYNDGGLAVAPEQAVFTVDHLPLDAGSSWGPPPSDSSDISVPTRGWASAAGSMQSRHTGDPTPLDAVWALEPKPRSCHLCFEVGHFLMECPLLGPEAKLAAQTRREAKFSGSRLHPQTSPMPPSPRGYHPASAQPPKYGAAFRAPQPPNTLAATLVEGAIDPRVQMAHEPSPSENEAGDT